MLDKIQSFKWADLFDKIDHYEGARQYVQNDQKQWSDAGQLSSILIFEYWRGSGVDQEIVEAIEQYFGAKFQGVHIYNENHMYEIMVFDEDYGKHSNIREIFAGMADKGYEFMNTDMDDIHTIHLTFKIRSK